MEKIKTKNDDKELVVIDYYDRINKQWIKVEVTKEVARFMKADKQKFRRKQNQYNYYNLPFDEVFDNEENEDKLIDSSNLTMEQEEELTMELAEFEHKRYLVEQALAYLTETQRTYTRHVFFENMTFQEIANLYEINNTSSISKVIKAAVKNIKKYIETTQN